MTRVRAAAVMAVTLVIAACSPGSLSVSPASATPTSSPATTGSISGILGYPAGSQPAMVVYAIRADTNLPHFLSVRARENQPSFTIDGLPPGVYHIVAYLESDPQRAGAYSQFVLCGLATTCTDHTLVPVSVRAGEAVQGIKVLDWYAKPGTFPARPTG